MGSRLLCICEQRINAMHAVEFIYLPLRRVWCFTEGPHRRMSAKARWLGGERSDFFVDHSGEPWQYEVCPWCGGDLPGVVALYFTNPLQQADGEGEVGG